MDELQLRKRKSVTVQVDVEIFQIFPNFRILGNFDFFRNFLKFENLTLQQQIRAVVRASPDGSNLVILYITLHVMTSDIIAM